MTNARENVAPTNLLTPRDYHIAGNDITAYYDAANKLVFVLDRTIDAAKPNVLLVISSVGDRKWDDILANDYNMDLETVRPKKDNKYQKLDIEYDGLAAYDELIAASRDGGDVDAAAAQLRAVRDASIRRAAADRLAAANAVAATARDTIVKTNDTIAELQARIKALRSKLAQQRREIGREPTKQSAAKILRTEAQIDVTNEKLNRAKKRLANAQRRLTAAMADADDAQSILDMKPVESPAATPRARAASVPAAPVFTQIAVPNDEMNASDDNDDADNDMDNSAGDVQPLFDQDPKILDENIAFKPIEFNTPVFHPIDRPAPVDMTPVASEQMSETVDEPETSMDAIAPEPLTFTPPEPLMEKSTDAPAELNIAPVFVPISTPVLDTIKPLDSVSDNDPAAPTPISVVPVITESEPTAAEPIADLPEIPTIDDMAMNVAPDANPVPEIETAPADSSLRPVSPLTGDAHGTGGTSSRGGRPTVLYYVMLIALIVLSIFTLWLYQKNSSNVTPDLVSARNAPETVVENPAPAPAPQVPAAPMESAVLPEPGTPDTVPEPEWAVVEPQVIDTPVDDVEPVVDDLAPMPMTPDIDMTAAEVDIMPAQATEPEMVPGGDVVYNTIETYDDAPVSDMDTTSPMVNKPIYDVSPGDKSVVPVAADDMGYMNDDQYYYSDDYAF